jgi:hypothetical protein
MCKCESDNHDSFIGEMNIRRPGLKSIDGPIAWDSRNCLSAWIVAVRNSSCLKPNCAVRRWTATRRDNRRAGSASCQPRKSQMRNNAFRFSAEALCPLDFQAPRDCGW